jgi:hypothetical protein
MKQILQRIAVALLMTALLANAAHAIMVGWHGTRPDDGLQEVCICNIDAQGRTRCLCAVWGGKAGICFEPRSYQAKRAEPAPAK